VYFLHWNEKIDSKPEHQEDKNDLKFIAFTTTELINNSFLE
jgi:hypothetical protein